MFVDILLAMAFLVLVVCLVVKNNSCGYSSSWKFFLFDLNIILLLFFAEDFNLFNCVFVTLTLASWELKLPFFIILCHFLEKTLIFFLWFFSKNVKANIDWVSPAYVALSLASSSFSCPTNAICWIVFGSASNSFCLTKSTAINL